MILDILLSLVTIYCLYVGFNKGILKTVFVTASLFIGFAIAINLTAAVANILRDSMGQDSPFIPVVAFLLTLIGTIMLIRILGKMIEGGLKAVKLNIVNKLAGSVLMASIGIFLFSCLISFSNEAGLISDAAKSSSQFYALIENVPEKGFAVIRRIFPFLRDMWDNMMDAVA